MAKRLSWVGGLLMMAIAPIPYAAAESLTDQTPNVDPPTTTAVGEVRFPFTHRFNLSNGKVGNSPTFTLSTGLTERLETSGRYATNSDVNGQFNEFEGLLKYQLLPERLSLLAGYNTAAGSLDAGIVGSQSWGNLTVRGIAKGFSSGLGVGGPTAALGAGILWHLNQFLALSADYNGIVGAQKIQAIADQVPEVGLVPAWSLGVQFVIPYSPHSVGLTVTNANTHTLQGTSRGGTAIRAGFEFLIPFRSFDRWFAIVMPPTEPAIVQASPTLAATPSLQAPSALPQATPAPVSLVPVSAPPPQPRRVEVVIEGFQYKPRILTVKAGTTVRWTNRDDMDHTSDSDRSVWRSGRLKQGRSYTQTFDQPGDYPYHCEPHPFMKGTIHVD